jgi:5-methylthioribose kinase
MYWCDQLHHPLVWLLDQIYTTLAMDLGTTIDVLQWLDDTPFAATKVDPLSGGTANFVFRLSLKHPYKGRQSLVLKHAKPYVTSGGQRFPLAVERQVR